jgi:hypothetical protein
MNFLKVHKILGMHGYGKGETAILEENFDYR